MLATRLLLAAASLAVIAMALVGRRAYSTSLEQLDRELDAWWKARLTERQ